MAQFENHAKVAGHIANEVAAKLVILGVDWRDSVEMAALANRLLDFDGALAGPGVERFSGEDALVDLFGLVGIMHRTMAEGADSGRLLQGNLPWKALARAMWSEKERRGPRDVPRGT